MTMRLDGRFVEAHSEGRIDVINPATQEVLARVSDEQPIGWY